MTKTKAMHESTRLLPPTSPAEDGESIYQRKRGELRALLRDTTPIPVALPPPPPPAVHLTVLPPPSPVPIDGFPTGVYGSPARRLPIVVASRQSISPIRPQPSERERENIERRLALEVADKDRVIKSMEAALGSLREQLVAGDHMARERETALQQAKDEIEFLRIEVRSRDSHIHRMEVDKKTREGVNALVEATVAQLSACQQNMREAGIALGAPPLPEFSSAAGGASARSPSPLNLNSSLRYGHSRHTPWGPSLLQ